MWLLIEKSTNIIRDIQAQCPSATSDFECVEDKGINDRSKFGYTYDKQAKQYTPPPPASVQPHQISATAMTAEIDNLKAEVQELKTAKAQIVSVNPDSSSAVPTDHIGSLVLATLVGGIYYFKKIF